MDRKAHGLTEAERVVLRDLGRVWDGLAALDNHHPSDLPEAAQAVHVIQMIVAYRVARRVDPEDWWQPLDEDHQKR